MNSIEIVQEGKVMRWKRLFLLICFMLIVGWATDIKGKIGFSEGNDIGPSLAVV